MGVRELLTASDSIEEIEELLKSIDNINIPSDDFGSESILIWAAIHGHNQVIAGLLQHPQTNPNIQSKNGYAALILAAYNGHDQVIAELLKHSQINPNIQSKNGYTTLILTAYNGHDQVVTGLLKHPQTNPNIQNENGDTALTIASKKGHKEVVSIIKDNLKMRSTATIRQTARLLYQNKNRGWTDNKVGFFANMPSDLSIKIAGLTGDPSVHTEAQANKIATTSYGRITL